MRLIVTSDLHLHRKLTLAERIETLVKQIAAERPNAVVLAGDLAHSLDAFNHCLALFRALLCPRYVLAGNHDLWRDEEHGYSTEHLWTQALPRVCERQDAIWLEDTTAVFGDLALVGSMAWYDYSAMDADANVSVQRLPELKRKMSNDARRMDWSRTDPAFAAELSEGLLQRIARTRAARIAVVTHVPVLEAQMHRKPGDRAWGVANAFFGNLTLGARLLRDPRICAIISGHTHFGIDTHVGHVAVRVVGSDYGAPTFTSIDL